MIFGARGLTIQHSKPVTKYIRFTI